MTGVASTSEDTSGFAALAGRYVVRPGRSPSIDGGRPPLAGLLLAGQPAALAAPRLSAVFSLCGRAHALCAELAVTAAGAYANAGGAAGDCGGEGDGDRNGAGDDDGAGCGNGEGDGKGNVDRNGAGDDHDAGRGEGERDGEDARSATLARETIAEHLRRIWLDWPARLVGGVPCALPDVRAAGTREWIERHVLGEPADGWLARWDQDPRACLAAWTARATSFPASLLLHCRTVADALRMPPRALRIDGADRARLRRIGAAIAGDPRFAQRPEQDGAPAETGVWTRCGDPHAAAYDSAWLRLGARVAELARLAAGGPAAFALRSGALALAPGEALAWCETARGVLIHWVRLVPGDAARVADYRVVSPTEWNFHPDGTLAHALARVDVRPDGGGDAALAARVGALMGAFDPCIAYALETAAPVRRDDDHTNGNRSTCMK
ncbi:TPA: hydrogenase maturation factor HoxV/HupK [Burkholderia vietnamiensis]|nr:hydrogenase maturation factor HoxV/HupK [Burkholderia vietnamiensis]HDR9232469.1 hydrogenase maturation factor HoxV/HupK [Burkholderia vietnamiensis]